jgi:hypothetical protein
MTIVQIPTGPAPVTATGASVIIHDLIITHAEAASFVRSQLADHGPEAAADLVRRALPVGLLALSAGTAGIDSGALTRTLDGFAERVDTKALAAFASLDQALTRLREGEEAVGRTATSILQSLPAQLEAALAGQAGNVRASVADATRTVQAAGLQELTTALTRHSESFRDAFSLDREGPVRMLRHDLLEELNGTRRELGEQMALVRSLLEAAQAAKAAGAKSSRAVGAANEHEAMNMCEEIVTSAGDLFERTGGQPGVGGTTRRTGDGVATLTHAITGHGRKVRLVMEAKARSRPLSAASLAKEIQDGCRVRDAAGGLVLVPTRAEVPGECAFARVDTNAYVVAADDYDTVQIVYLLLREQVAMSSLRHDDNAEIDLAQVEARIALALSTLDEFDEVGRLAGQAERALIKLKAIGAQAQAKARKALTEGVSLLHD